MNKKQRIAELHSYFEQKRAKKYDPKVQRPVAQRLATTFRGDEIHALNQLLQYAYEGKHPNDFVQLLRSRSLATLHNKFRKMAANLEDT